MHVYSILPTAAQIIYWHACVLNSVNCSAATSGDSLGSFTVLKHGILQQFKSSEYTCEAIKVPVLQRRQIFRRQVKLNMTHYSCYFKFRHTKRFGYPVGKPWCASKLCKLRRSVLRYLTERRYNILSRWLSYENRFGDEPPEAYLDFTGETSA